MQLETVSSCNMEENIPTVPQAINDGNGIYGTVNYRRINADSVIGCMVQVSALGSHSQRNENQPYVYTTRKY